jgi:hypothetical protein
MEEEDNIIVRWAQEGVETLYSLLNNNKPASLPSERPMITLLWLIASSTLLTGCQLLS